MRILWAQKSNLMLRAAKRCLEACGRGQQNKTPPPPALPWKVEGPKNKPPGIREQILRDGQRRPPQDEDFVGPVKKTPHAE